MKHPECTSWCIDTEDIINAVGYLSIWQKELFKTMAHIDTVLTDGGNSVRVQGLISQADFMYFLSKPFCSYTGKIALRYDELLILTFNIDK